MHFSPSWQVIKNSASVNVGYLIRSHHGKQFPLTYRCGKWQDATTCLGIMLQNNTSLQYTECLFYLTTIICQVPPLLHRAYGDRINWAMLIR